MLIESKKKLDFLLHKTYHLFGLKLTIYLKYDLKGVCTIGQCRKIQSSVYTIRLHEYLLNKYRSLYLNDVLTHELAHAIQMEHYKYKTKPHGKEWKHIMSLLENTTYNAKLRPTYELHNIKQNFFSYTCKCEHHHKLSKIRHNKILKGKEYICKKCKTLLFKLQD